MRMCSIVAALGLAMMGYATNAHPVLAAESKKLVLEQFFKGDLTAEGVFTNVWTGAKRGLSVKMHGQWDGKKLTLKEDFVYSDGEKDQKTWVFTKLADGVYSGLREDVLQPADVRNEGDEVTFAYTAHIGGFDLSFRDRLVQLDAKTVHNTADVSLFGFIKVGEVDLTMVRKGH